MAKLKSSFTSRSSTKLPSLANGSTSGSNLPKPSIAKDSSGNAQTVSNAGTVVQALNFGSLHTKATGSGSSSTFGTLLNAASSGGASSLISGGILSVGGLGFIGKLLGLFGGSKSTPAAPTPFVMPASQVQTLNIGSGSNSSSVALGVQSSVNAGGQSGPAYQVNSTPNDHAAQSAQVVQIVKQALLTSSSLNDVVSEI
jgi:hypothetical protein